MFTPLLVGLLALAPQQTDTTVSVRPSARLELENFGGSVVIRGWDRNEVRVRASHGRREPIRVYGGPSSAVVRIEAEGRSGIPRSVDFEINAPAEMSLKLSGTYTDIDVQGMRGEVDCETTQGDVIVSGGSGRVRLESIQGKVVLSNARGRIDVSSVNQGIYVKDVSGDVVAESVNGAIILEGIQSSNVDAASVNGIIVYDGTIRDGGNYLMASHNGAIWIVVPERTNAKFSVSTYNGRMDASFPVTMNRTASQRHFSFVIGSGSAEVDIESFSGGVRLRRPGESRPTFPDVTKSKPKSNDQEHQR
ncbi:MAG: DUF4097 family beta strand repeat-containing protein [Gemmatimonadota bacterium]